MADVWYYVENDARAGPVSSEQLRRFLRSPRGGEAALVWHSGLSDWKRAGEINELADVFKLPPPVPRGVVQSPVPLSTRPGVTPATESVPNKAVRIGGTIIGGLIGWLAVKALGSTLIWPAALIGVTWFILAKCKVE